MNIQIVEDDRSLSDGIEIALSDVTATCHKAYLIKEAISGFDQYKDELSLIILDLNLPDGIGYDYLKYVRSKSEVPVLILTANDLEMDEVKGLTMGADDFLTKPFSLAVLRARVHALTRRSKITQRAEEPKCAVYTLEDMVFDFDRLVFTAAGEEIQLSVNEQKLLKIFLDNKGRVLTRNMLMDRLWGNDGDFVDENALSVTVNRLRSKIDANRSAKHITTVYGQGYRFE